MATDMPPDMEARFIEQEHRVVRVVQNFFDRKKWEPDDPRRDAARNALLWRLLAPGTAAIAAGGLVAGGSLAVLIWQTSLIADQNEYFREQNSKLQLQIDQQRVQDETRRRTEILEALYESQTDKDGSIVAKANYRIRTEAVKEFLHLERVERQRRSGLASPLHQKGRFDLSFAKLDQVELVGADLQHGYLVHVSLKNGALIASNLDMAKLNIADLEGTSFYQSHFYGADLSGAYAHDANFRLSSMRRAKLIMADLVGANFLGADLRDADLTSARGLTPAKFLHANIANVQGLSPDTRRALLASGAVEITDDEVWKAFRSSKASELVK